MKILCQARHFFRKKKNEVKVVLFQELFFFFKPFLKMVLAMVTGANLKFKKVMEEMIFCETSMLHVISFYAVMSRNKSCIRINGILRLIVSFCYSVFLMWHQIWNQIHLDEALPLHAIPLYVPRYSVFTYVY